MAKKTAAQGGSPAAGELYFRMFVLHAMYLSKFSQFKTARSDIFVTLRGSSCVILEEFSLKKFFYGY